MKKNKPPKNRDFRGELRVDTVQKVKFKTNFSKKDSLVHGEGFSQNLSENGCCLFLDQEIPMGSLIEVTFERLDKNNQNVRIIGKVIWQKDYLSGIKFIPDAQA